MKSSRYRGISLRLWVAASFFLCGTATSVQAVIWTNASGGNWSVAGNWNPASPPDAVDAVADFSTLNITADTTATVNTTSRTVGSLIFGDATTPSHNWTLNRSGSATLTLKTSSGTPSIQVKEQTATLTVPLEGNQGFTKTGTGTLVLNANGPVLHGGVTVSNGELSASGTNANTFGNNPLSIGASGTLRLSGHTGSTTVFTREISGSGVLATNVVAVVGPFPHTTVRPYALNDTTFSGTANTNARFIINTAGPGAWTLTGGFASFVRSTSAVSNGELVLAGSAAFDAADFNRIEPGTFGTFTLDNRTTNLGDRYRDGSSLTMDGGTTFFRGNAAAPSSETFGQLAANSGTANTLRIEHNGQNVTLTVASISLSGAINLHTNGTLGGNVKVIPTTAPITFEGSGAGQLVRRMFNNADFIRYDAANGFVPYTAYQNPADINSVGTSAALLVDSNTTNQTLSADRIGAALKINGAQNINLGGFTFEMGGTGGNNALHILKAGAGTATISNGELSNRGSAPYIDVRVHEGTLEITSEINLIGNNRFVKSGTGILVLNPSALNSATNADQLVIAEGVVRMNPNSAGLSGPLRVLAGGVMEITGTATYSPTVGTAANNVVLTNGGGFAAFGGDVDFTTQLNWGGSSHLNDGKPLALNSTTADSVITLSGGLNLAGANTSLNFREVRVADNTGGTTDKAVISGQIVGTANQSHLLKTGAGLLELTHSNNTYLGETVIREGRLNVNGTLAAVAAPSHGTVTVMSGGTLGGTGVINRPVVAEAGSIVAPGTSPGSLVIGSTFDLESAANLQIEIAGPSFTLNGFEQYDRLKVTGLTTLAGTLSVSLIDGFLLGDSQFFGILDAVGGLDGFFSNYAEGATVLMNNGYRLAITYNGLIADSGTPAILGGNDVVLYTELIPVPEPSTWALLLLGMACLGGASLRRTRRNVGTSTD